MPIQLRLSDRQAVDDLLSFLERCGLEAVRAQDDLVEVEPPHQLHAEQARMEVTLLVRVWQVVNGSSDVEVR
jgi:hypothetical protein